MSMKLRLSPTIKLNEDLFVRVFPEDIGLYLFRGRDGTPRTPALLNP